MFPLHFKHAWKLPANKICPFGVYLCLVFFETKAGETSSNSHLGNMKTVIRSMLLTYWSAQINRVGGKMPSNPQERKIITNLNTSTFFSSTIKLSSSVSDILPLPGVQSGCQPYSCSEGHKASSVKPCFDFSSALEESHCKPIGAKCDFDR